MTDARRCGRDFPTWRFRWSRGFCREEDALLLIHILKPRRELFVRDSIRQQPLGSPLSRNPLAHINKAMPSTSWKNTSHILPFIVSMPNDNQVQCRN